METEINQFHLKEEEEVYERPFKISDFEEELDRASIACSPKLIVARVDPNSEEDKEMDLNPRRGLKDLLIGRYKGSSSKDVPKS